MSSFPIQQGLFKYDLADHFAILGVPLDAEPRQIRQRYLKIAYRLHPDTCKATTEREKQRASKILSKLVNPAYETLSKERSRTEYLLVLSQMGQNLALELSSMTLASEEAQKLTRSVHNIDLMYHKLMLPLMSEQYKDLDALFPKIAQISELNLVYLMLKQGTQVKPKPQPKKITPPPQPPKPSPETPPVSPVATALRRAQEYLDRNNISQAITELREALKTEPNNGTCHGLLGLAYLRENQVTMAKVHINKARKVSPQDPIVINAKEALDRLAPDKSKPKDQDKGGGLFGSLFGKKK
ncbi:J domain-containing protein [Aphanothece sacrum]|uniref:Molecular chaperone DnaJ n=1 Tax=Aphanothece sacrum FPU1 TaxID=1920663 RepID=A0A401ILW3_APHSA|nr:DnaJ domain-containing protein [Aphanothece sacrum]GBF82239.1 molecular chaperone DnaJ [Aphanothece sacrum FPU1]GBF87223.1 molecular chaperone DnaJ [Aphanothece sacrum FPU3]